MKDLDIDALRAFLSGADTRLATGEILWGYFDGKLLGDPLRHQNRSEIVDGRLIVVSRRDERLAEYSVNDLAFVASLSVSRMLQKYPSVYMWLVDKAGQPLAEVPWGATVQRQADEVGLNLRRPLARVSGKAFKALRPQKRLD